MLLLEKKDLKSMTFASPKELEKEEQTQPNMAKGI